MKQIKFRRSLVAVAAIAVAMGSLTAEARVGTPTSRSSSVSSSPAKISAPAPATPARVGGGQSIGMQRPSVMESVRKSPTVASAPSASSNSYSNSGYQATPRAPIAEKKDRSWVAPAAIGAAVGAAATYALTDHDSHPAPAQVQQQYVPQPTSGQGNVSGYQGGVSAPMAAPAPQVVMVPPQQAPASSSSSGFVTFMLLMVLGGIGYFAYRRISKDADVRPATGSAVAAVRNSDSELAETAKQMFINLQKLNNEGNLDALKRQTTFDVYSALKSDIENRAQPSTTSVVQLNATVVDKKSEAEDKLISVRFTGLVSESEDRSPDAIDEVWHFIQRFGQSDWKVAGIEQV